MIRSTKNATLHSNYKKNIKPAPDPHYLLDKFFGNLTIQEYRKLLKTEHLLLVVDKPMTRVLPELFEDNDKSQNFDLRKWVINTEAHFLPIYFEH